jgi:hypothetical protein
MAAMRRKIATTSRAFPFKLPQVGRRVDVILFGEFPGLEAGWVTTRALVVATQPNLDMFCVVYGTDFIWLHVSQLFKRRFDGDEKGYDQ